MIEPQIHANTSNQSLDTVVVGALENVSYRDKTGNKSKATYVIFFRVPNIQDRLKEAFSI